MRSNIIIKFDSVYLLIISTKSITPFKVQLVPNTIEFKGQKNPNRILLAYLNYSVYIVRSIQHSIPKCS